MNTGNPVKSVRNFLSVCFLFLCAASLALAQAGRGSIAGTITDPNGAVVAGAQVVLLNSATGLTQHTVSSGAGLYSFISLNPGQYQVTASQTGFASVAQDKITVNVDQATEVNITLRVGATTEKVTVTEALELVEPTNSTVGTLIPSEQIDRVPLLYRNVYDLIQLSAGVIAVNGSPNSSDSFQSVQNISNGRPGVDVSADTINGSLVGSVYYMLDGAPIGIAENNSAAIIPAMNIPEDGVEEVRVETQNTPASYQSGGGGVISLVSKSGTNKIHGDAFGVFRPDALSANDYFLKLRQLSQGMKNTPPSFHRYQEGGAIGGPIKKDKLFFFGDYEHTDQVQFEGIDTFTVPTTAEKGGDFSAFLDPTSPTTLAATSIYDPTQLDIGGLRQAFAGNKITNPNSIGLLFLKNMPHCNIPDPTTCDQSTVDPGNPTNFGTNPNFGLPGLDPFRAHRFDVRVDWNASEKQRIFTRFSYDHLFFTQANVFQSPGWDPNYAQNLTNGRNVLVADDLTLNASTVLNLRYSFTRHHEVQGGQASYSSVDITTLGFPASLAAEQVNKQLPFMVFNDLSGSSQEGVGGTADYNYFLYASMNSDASATVNKVHGKHELAFGFEWMKRYLNVTQPPAAAGSYGFDLTATDQSASASTPVGGSDFASILVGMAMAPGTEGNTGYPNFTKDVKVAESNPYYAAFVEDTFHVSKSLTVTAGLRWDIFGGRNERFNRLEYFDPKAQGSLNGVNFTGAEIFTNGSNRSPFATNMHDFGPRLAFAWQPVQHFVVRGGAGIYYGPSTHNVASAGNDTDGYTTSTTWNGTCFNADGNTVFNGTAACVGAPAGSPPLTPGNYTGPFSLNNPFPTGVIQPISSPSGLTNNIGVQLSTVLRSQRTQTTYNFNFGLEYELPHQVIVSVGYIGSRGLFLPISNVDLNQLDLGTIQKYNTALCVDSSPTSNACNSVATGGVPNPFANLPGSPFQGQPFVPLWYVLQPFPQFGNGGYDGTVGVNGGNGILVNGYAGGDSEYSSLQTKVQKRLTGHFTTLATFTWGKLMTDDGHPPLGFVGTHSVVVQDWRNLRFEHAIAPQDVKYSFTGQASYDLPIGKGQAVNLNGVANAIAGGWTVNGILYLGTGVPIAAPLISAPTGSYFNQRADMVCDPSKGFSRSANQWVNNSCFAFPTSPFVPGTAPAYLDHVRTEGARNLDMSIYKMFKIKEAMALRFDISAYNLTNKHQFAAPGISDMTSTSGAPYSAITNNVNTPRQFQFGARFTF
jgi:Carboxypeptidase regulatory-like domain